LLIDGPYIGLTLPKAQGAAGLEYDTSFGGVEEGVGFLTANHAQIANIASNAEIAAQSDLQAQWLEGLHDFAGERLEDTMINSIAAIASSELSGNEATLAQIFGVETAFSVVEDAVEESALGTASASWDTFVGPAIAAVAAIGVESWELANAAGVQPQLQAAVCAVAATATNGCPGTTLETLPQYAQDPNGRQLILDALIKSTMPDYIVARLGDPTYGSAPSAGPVVLSDPNFAQGSHPPTASFTSTGWSGNSNTASVADGWFVMSANTSTGPGALRYTSNIPYLTPSALNSTVGGTTTITPINVEQWRAWLDGQNFLAQRAGIQAGFGQVEDAVNACPTVVVGGGGSVTATVIDLGNICVKVSSEPFPVQKGDEIVIGGQVRTAAGNEFFNQSDGNYYIQTTEAFENPPPAAGPITVLVHPDGNCLTSSALGSRVSTPDCTSGPTINTDHGVVTIVPPTPTATFSLAGLGSITFGGPAFNVANFFVSNSSGVVTFSLAGRSVGCTVTSNGTVTLTGAAAGADSCIIIALQAASAGFGTAAPLSGSFHINQATPTVSITGGAFGFNGSPRSASGFAYGLGGVADVQSPAVTFSYVGTNGTNYAAGSIAPTYPGSYQVTANFVGNANYATASAVATITINSATTVVTMNSPAAVQYSDRTTLSASVSPASLGTQAQSGTVQFYLKGAAVGSPQAINSAGVATLSGLQVTLAESSYAVKAVFTSANSDFAGGNASATQQINPENAFLSYTGDMIGQVGTSLNLRATVWDSAAAGYSGINPESAATATIGDITKMWVAFDVYPVGSCAIGTPGTLYAPVTLTPTAGIGTAAVTLSSASEISDCVVARLVAGSAGGTNQFYIAPNAPTAGVDFYVNSGQFATGGGWINDPTGSHGNFAFNGRYNSSGSPKGQISYMYQAPYNGVAANFVIQSNALSALQFTGTKDPISSTLQGKASVQIKRASDGVLLFSAGNYAFSATVTDSGLNGQSGKQFSLTVYGSNGVMFHVVPAATPLQGGNVVVHSAK